MTINDRIRKIRKDAGLSQKEVAERLHVTAVAVSGWETGNVPIGESRLYRIAIEFNVNIDWLLTGKGKQYVSPTDVDDETRRQIEDEGLLKLFMSLPIDVQERVLNVLRDCVKRQGDSPRNIVNNSGTINGNINQE